MERLDIDIDAFFNRIALLLKKKQTTQSDMFKYIDCTRQYFYYCKKNKILPNIVLLCQIAKYFNVSINYILWGKDEHFTDEEILLLIKIKNIPADKRQSFFEHIFTYINGIESTN